MSYVQFLFEQTDTGWSAYCPQIPGVGVAGATKDEAEQLLREAIAFHHEGLLFETLCVSGTGAAFVNQAIATCMLPFGEIIAQRMPTLPSTPYQQAV